MQENRSFDHYYGTLRGVRGFADRQALRYSGGTTVFEQPDGTRAGRGHLLPFHLDWVAAKTARTMGYFTRADLPFNYALADAFTICDGYHQSIFGPTSPNRMYFLAGTSNGWTDNPPNYTVEFANVNPLWLYRQYQESMKAATTAGQRLAVQGAVQPWQPNAGTPLGPDHVKHVLAQFTADCAAGTIPQVSWIVAPREYSEHPSASPSYGAHYARTVLDALTGNPALWKTTALFVTYDEHDGFFDHVLPPCPEPGEKNEFIDFRPAGLGPRVPMIVCSPWTRGGFVDSNTYDHTSVLRFLEAWTGVRAPGITGWRRSVTGSAPSLRLVLANDGAELVAYTLTANDDAGATQVVSVRAKESTEVTWPVDADGYYDVIIAADAGDGFARRYA
jgi:phospholipase C